jgi:ferredoxin-thioredoxin reductase catalytic subunit
MSEIKVKDSEIEELRKKLDKEAEEAGYHLNPNLELTKQLLRGILINQKRYGYGSCPCRLASGVKKEDLDIICPCDYRDPDLGQFGTCFCGLYVSEEVVKGKKKIGSIPERRPTRKGRKKMDEKPEMKIKSSTLEKFI